MPPYPSAPRPAAANAPELALKPLLTAAGWELLSRLPDYCAEDVLKLSASLRQEGYRPELIAAALTQQRLRAKAATKFGAFAKQMLFTPDGLEQATRLAVAAHHAARYLNSGAQKVADLGCGIGADSLALAGLGLNVLAVERDESSAALALVNLMPFPRAQVLCADALSLDLPHYGVDAIFSDPARRAGGKRISDPSQWSPPLAAVLALRQTIPNLGVKVAPGIAYSSLPSDAQVQWVSVNGQVVEAGIWLAALAPEGAGRSALVLRTQPEAPEQYRAQLLADPDCHNPASEPPQLEPIKAANELGTFLYEPDGAVIRAGLVAYVAQQLQARPLGSRIAYLTGDKPVPAQLQPFVHAWRIQQVLPLHLKTLKQQVAAQQIGRLEIHKRGIDVSPDQLRLALRLRGENAQTWVLSRIGTIGAKTASAHAKAKGVVLVVQPVHG